MKTSLFLLTLMTSLLVHAQSKNTICGYVDPESMDSSEAVVLSIFNPAKNTYVEKTVTAVTSEAQDFLGVIYVHGGAICNHNANREAPLEICFTGDIKKNRAQYFFCGKKNECRGTKCGGNGFSVNSGSR